MELFPLCTLISIWLVVELKFLGTSRPKHSYCKSGCTIPDQFKLNVHIIPHSHDDLGWLRTVDEYFYGHPGKHDGVKDILDTVIAALKVNPSRRFVQAETAFFHKWWKEQDEKTRQVFRKLVDEGQLEFVGGAWSMNDEAVTHYQSIIDQFTLGLRTINGTVGECGRPRIGWQVDPFGHSREMASLFAQMGYDGIFMGRIDFRDKRKRIATESMEMLWETNLNLGDEEKIFSGVLYNLYQAPTWFCFDSDCKVTAITDIASQMKMVGRLAMFIKEQDAIFKTNNIMITMGDDFYFTNASINFHNLDLLIEGFDKFKQYSYGTEIKLFYSTPSCYLQAVIDYLHQKDVKLPIKRDDFFPYATTKYTYWTGFYTSRPTLKRLERQGNNLLQIAKQISVHAHVNEMVNSLKEAMGVMQHHDAITGTSKQYVADDYTKILVEAVEKTVHSTSRNMLSLLKKNEKASLQFSSCLLTNMSYCPLTQGQSFIVTIYNPLAQPRSEYVRLPVDATSFIIKNPNGEDVLYDVVPTIDDFRYLDKSVARYDLVFRSQDIPPHGFKIYHVKVVSRKNDEPPHLRSMKKLDFGNSVTGFTINGSTNILDTITINSKTLKVSQEFLYYISEAKKSQYKDERSGAYIFRPSKDQREALNFEGEVKIAVFRGKLVEEVHQVFNEWAKQVIRIYKDTNYVEFDWLIGPIDVSFKKDCGNSCGCRKHGLVCKNCAAINCTNIENYYEPTEGSEEEKEESNNE